MQIHSTVARVAFTAAFAVVFLVLAPAALGAPGMSLSKTLGTPTTTFTVSGSGFSAYEAVDLYFDTTNQVFAVTDGTGAFPATTMAVPASAVPGSHWITAKGEGSHLAIQKSFSVHTGWLGFRYSNFHRGLNAFENVLSPSTVSGLDEAWATPTGPIDNSSPAISTSGASVYVGSYDSKLYAVNAATGAVQWAKATGAQIDSSPALAGSNVYVGSRDGKLYAFSATCSSGGGSCTPLWTGATGNGIRSSPAVANGIVYVGSADGKLYAFKVGCASGGGSCTPLWTGATGNLIESSPAVSAGVVYVGSWDSKLYAFPASCGSGGVSCSPLWTGTTGAIGFSSPAVANGVVYVGSLDGKLYAFSSSCGSGGAACSPLWTGATGNQIYSSPAVAGGVVYVGSQNQKLYAFPASCSNPCATLWSASTGAGIASSPAVSDGTVYVGSGDGDLRAYTLSAGTLSPVPRPDPAMLESSTVGAFRGMH